MIIRLYKLFNKNKHPNLGVYFFSIKRYDIIFILYNIDIMSNNPEVILKKKSYDSTTDSYDGVVVFDNLTGKIYVGGECFSSDVKDAVLNSTTKEITITKTDNSTIVISTMNYSEINAMWEMASEDYVDLGVVVNNKRILFAPKNVGAIDITDFGNYYAWGEVETKGTYGWSTYKFNPSGDGETFTKYNSSDGLATLDADDDIVRVVMGGDWRMPTYVELSGLINQTTNEWVTNYQDSGHNGRLFSGNGNTLFIPAAGCWDGASLYGVGSGGSVWSRSLLTSNIAYGRSLNFSSSTIYTNNGNRFYGFSARGVVALEN